VSSCTYRYIIIEMTRRYTQALGFEDVFKRHVIASPVDRLVRVKAQSKRLGRPPGSKDKRKRRRRQRFAVL